MPASWLLHLGATYTIPNLKPIPEKDTRLGIFADINVNIPWPLGFTLTGGAKLITNWSNFQLSAGLGIGVTYHAYSMLELFYEVNNNIYGMDSWYHSNWLSGNDLSVISAAAFTIKPMLEFDWFITRHWFVGFAFDLPFNLGGATGGDERGEYNNNPVRCYPDWDDNEECFEFASDFVFFMQFDLYFHAGYKF